MRGSCLQTATSSKQRAEVKTTGAADSRIGGRKQKSTSRQQWRCERGTAQQLEGPALPAGPTRSRSRDVRSSSERKGAPLAEPFVSLAFWDVRSSAHARRVPPNSSSSQFVESAAPPTHPIIHGFGYFREPCGHINSTAVRCIFGSGVAATATATADSRLDSQRAARSDRS